MFFAAVPSFRAMSVDEVPAPTGGHSAKILVSMLTSFAIKRYRKRYYRTHFSFETIRSSITLAMPNAGWPLLSPLFESRKIRYPRGMVIPEAITTASKA